MIFPTGRLEREWNSGSLQPLLRVIVKDASEYAADFLDWNFRFTSIYRTPEENRKAEAKTAIHTLWRAIDIGAIEVDRSTIQAITDYVNNRWIYDPERPNLPVCYSAPHGSGPHCHYQVHKNTQRRTT